MVRDLLKELKQNNNVTTTTPDRKQKLPTFQTAQLIQAQTKELVKAGERVKALRRALAQETRSREVAERKREYRELLNAVGNASKRVRTSLARYSKRISECGFVDQIEKNQVQLAQFRFFEELDRFTALSTQFERQQERRVQRVLKCMDVHKTDDEIAELAANERDFQVLLRKELGTLASDEMLERLVDLEGYHQALERLAGQTREIREQWQMLNLIVDCQQEQVDRIVDNVEDAHESCHSGVQHVEAASWYQKITRNMQFLGFAGAGAALTTAL